MQFPAIKCCQHGVRALRRHQEGAGDGAEEGQVHRGQGQGRREDVLGRQVGRQGTDGLISRVCLLMTSDIHYSTYPDIHLVQSNFRGRPFPEASLRFHITLTINIRFGSSQDVLNTVTKAC